LAVAVAEQAVAINPLQTPLVLVELTVALAVDLEMLHLE
jgi:hypothetical protein